MKLDLRNVILLYIQSNMDLLWNPKLVVDVYNSKKNIRLHINRGEMLITHKAQVYSYKPHVWFEQKSITNIVALNNIINQYFVTYTSLDDMFIVHW